jgi:Uncharacterized protein conserved in bacteria
MRRVAVALAGTAVVGAAALAQTSPRDGQIQRGGSPPQGPGVEVRRAEPVQPGGDQQGDPPVRRAQPVDPDTIENPPWMERVRPAQPVERPAATPTPAPTPEPRVEPKVERAVPVERATPVERAEPAPTPTPAPVAEPNPQPETRVTESTESSKPEEPAGEGEIRFAPAENVPNMSQSLLAGNGFYRRKMYDLAIPEFEKFLIAEPNAEGRDGALFRLGESHRALGNENAARTAYQRLLAEFREGEFVGAGAYRLGQIYFSNGNFASAASMFRKAVEHSTENEVKITAKFYEAGSLEKLERPAEAAKVYSELIRMEGENPYVDTARFRLAEYDSGAGRKQDAFEEYEKLSREAKEPKMRAEAAVKAGAIAADLGRRDEAKKLFDTALNMPGLGDWRGVARLGVIRIAYEAGQYKEAAAITEEQIRELPKEAVPDALLLSANARRQLGRHSEALEMYDRIIREFAGSSAAGQARFQRLVCLDATGAPDIEKQIDEFLTISTNPTERAQATLLKAETLFKQGDYANAAPLYAKVLATRLPTRLLNQALYKLGWCQAQIGQYSEAAQSFSQFLAKNSKGDLVAAALAQRALAHQKTEAYEAALKDFDRLIEEFPEAKERELALQQKALILGQQGKNEEMQATFAKLIEDYPKSNAAAQAHYWIGWAAFEKKDYPKALEALTKARELDPDGFGKRATVRILLIHYYAEDRDAVAAEIAKADPGSAPPEVLLWLGSKYYDEKNYAKAEEFLAPLADGNPVAPVDPDILINLARARLALGKYNEARDPVQRYLAAAKDPVARARALLASAEISLGTGSYEDANKLLEEALLLQPEGKYNAEARLLTGEVMMRRGDYDGAARAFMTVAVLYDDPAITPRALRSGADAYRKAGKAAEAKKAMDELARRFPEEGSTGTGTKPDTAKVEADGQ